MSSNTQPFRYTATKNNKPRSWTVRDVTTKAVYTVKFDPYGEMTITVVEPEAHAETMRKGDTLDSYSIQGRTIRASTTRALYSEYLEELESLDDVEAQVHSSKG